MAARHNHAPWRKTILVPFWIVQQLFLMIMIGLCALSLGVLSIWDENWIDSKFNDSGLRDGMVYRTVHIILPIWIAIFSVCLILTVTEIVLLARHNLKPLVFVFLNIIKAGSWTVVFVLDMISISTINGWTSTVAGIIIDGILILAFWIPLIYGVIVWRRFQMIKGEYVFVPTPTSAETYPSLYKQFVAEEAVAVEPTRPPGARRLTYNHTRDTRFESFRNERRSLSNPELKLGNEVIVTGNGSVPSVTVEDHDFDAFDMESARRSMNQSKGF